MNKRKKIRVFHIILAGVFVYCAYLAFNQQKFIYAKDMELKSIQARISEESKQNEELKRQKETLNSDEYIERVAREKLGMVKRNERIFVDINK